MKKTGEKIIVDPLTGKPSRLKQASPDSEIYKRGWTVGFFKPSKESEGVGDHATTVKSRLGKDFAAGYHENNWQDPCLKSNNGGSVART